MDVLDAVGSNIRIDARGAQVLRVLPRLNENVNEEWISDKTRFAHDGLTRRRLDRPYVRRGGRLVEAEWHEVLDLIARGSTNREIAEPLYLSPHTVKEHTSVLYRKLRARNRAEAVQRAQRIGLLG